MKMISRNRTLANLLAVVVLLLLFPASAQAGKVLHAGAIPEGQVIENDVFLTGQSPVVNGTVNGDVFIVGSDVIISGRVNGSVFVIAQNLKVSGEVSGNLYAAAVELTQQEGGQIGRSLYVLAVSLVTEQESEIGRNLNTVALSGGLRGHIERDTYAIIGPWEVFKLLRGYVNESIIGFAPPQSTIAEDGLEYVSYRTSNPHDALITAAKPQEGTKGVDWLKAALQSFLKFLIVGGLMLLAFPRQFKEWVEKIQQQPVASAGYGTLVLINGYLIPFIAAFLVGGLWLGLLYLSLSSLAWTVFWAGFGSLITLVALFSAAVSFLSKAIVAFLVGAFIFSKVIPRALQYRFLPLLLGLLIYVPLASIPYLGFFIGLVATLLGLGSIWLARKRSIQPVEAV